MCEKEIACREIQGLSMEESVSAIVLPMLHSAMVRCRTAGSIGFKRSSLFAAPNDVKRYFVSPEESGQICMLACILGKGGGVFFPKLGEEQMLTFSSICDSFLTAEGLKKKECTSDDEAKRFASRMPYDTDTYPVVYFQSDTTGEKAYEEFYVPGERINLDRFKALGVVEETNRRTMSEDNAFFDQLETLFGGDFTKEDVVLSIKKFIPNFEHEEKGKNLDQKM